MTEPRPERPWGRLCFAASLLVALPFLGSGFYDHKEGDLVAIAARPLAQLWDLGYPNQSHGWPLILHGWIELGGINPWWTRLLSVLLSSIGAVFAFRFGELLHSRRAGLAAAATYIVLPALHLHAREARMYGLFCACTLGALYFAARYARDLSIRDALGAAGLSLVAIYTHFFGFAVAAAALGSMAVSAFLVREGRGRRLAAIAGIGAALDALSVPQMLRLKAGFAYSGRPNDNYGLSGGLWDGMEQIGGHIWLAGAEDPVPWALGGVFVVSLVAFAAGIRAVGVDRSKAPVWWTKATLLLFVFGGLVGFIALAHRSDVRPRYLSMVSGPLAVGLGVFWAATPRRRLARGVAVLLAIPTVASHITGWVVGSPDWPAAAAWAEAHAGPSETYIAYPWYAQNVFSLYVDRPVRGSLPKEPSDRLWVLGSDWAAGGAGRVKGLADGWTLIEEVEFDEATVQRWERGQKVADRAFVLDRVDQTVAAWPDRSRVLLAGRMTRGPAVDDPIHRLRALAEVVVVPGWDAEGAPPAWLAVASMFPQVAAGDGWVLRARRFDGGVAVASLDLSERPDVELPPAARAAVAGLDFGPAALLVVPRSGQGAGALRSLGESLLLGSVSATTVQGLGAGHAVAREEGLVLPWVGRYEAPKRGQFFGHLALLHLGGDGEVAADLLGVKSGRDGRPRITAQGATSLDRTRRSPTGALKSVEPSAEAVRPLRHRLPDRARAHVELRRGGTRACLPLQGSSLLPKEEKGPDGEGVLSNRLRCGYDPRDLWAVVATTKQSFDEAVSECIWLHPPGKRPVVLTFEDVPMGSVLQGTAGVTDMAIDRNTEPVRFEVRVDGRSFLLDDVGTERGLRTWAVDTQAWAGRTADVELRASAEDTRWRHLCVTAGVVE